MSLWIIQLITSFLGSMGFAIIFNTKKKYIIHVSVGGLLCWAVYLISCVFSDGIFVPALLASAAAALYAEVFARILKVPATVIFVSSIIPLIPGSSLYYTMSYAVAGNLDMFSKYGMETIYFVLGITSGISFIWSLWYMVQKVYVMHIKKKN